MIVYQGIMLIMLLLYNHHILARIHKILRKLVLNMSEINIDMNNSSTNMSNSNTNMSNQNIAMNTLLTNIVNVNEDTATMKISDYYSNYNKYLNSGNYYYRNGKSKKALYNYFKALKYFKDVKLLFKISCIYIDMRKINESNIYL